MHVPKDERSKLDDKKKSYIFLRYGHEEFECRLWDPMNKMIIRSRDVVFLVDQLFVDGDKVEKPKSSIDILVSLDIVPPPIVHEDHGGDEQQVEQEPPYIEEDHVRMLMMMPL